MSQLDMRKRKKRNHRRPSSSSEHSDGDDGSSGLASRTSEDGLTSENELSSVSMDHIPPFGSPEYWDYKRAQLKIMVADRRKTQLLVKTVPRPPIVQNKFRLPNVFLDREVFLAVGGTSRACLMTNVAPFVDLNFNVSCPDLNILPSTIRLVQGQDVTSQLYFRAPSTIPPGKKTLLVEVTGHNVEPAIFEIPGISVTEALCSAALSERECVLSFGEEKSGLKLELNSPVQNASISIVLEAPGLRIEPSSFTLRPGQSIVGPFKLDCLPSCQAGIHDITLVCENASTRTQANLPQNPTRIKVNSAITIHRAISAVSFEPALDKLMPGLTAKARLVVDSAPARDTMLHLTCPEPAVGLSSTRLMLSAAQRMTESLFIQVSPDAKPCTFPIHISFTSFDRGQEKCGQLTINLAVQGPRAVRLADDGDTSSEVDSLLLSSPRNPQELQRAKADVSLEQLRHLLKDLAARKDKLQGQRHRRERNRIKSRMKAIEQRVVETEVAEAAKKRDPNRVAPFAAGKPPLSARAHGKRDPALRRFEDPSESTIFERRRNSVPTFTFQLTDSEDSDYLPRSEAFLTKRPSKPPRTKTPSVFNLNPKVFIEMMDFPVIQWNVEHVCCWLHSLGMGYRKYVRSFYETKVVGKKLLKLDSDQLRILGVTSDLHRERMFEEIKRLLEKPENVTTAAIVTSKDPPPGDPPTALFEIKPSLTPAEINNQIRELREFQKKEKGKQKKQTRLQCVQTIEKLELLLKNFEDDTEALVPSPSASSTPKQSAFKTPRETLRFQDSVFHGEKAFIPINKERWTPRREISEDSQSTISFFHDRERSEDASDTVSVSSMTMSELDDTEEFESKLTHDLYHDDLKYDDSSYVSDEEYETDGEDPSDNDISEITYGTPGYWAFKRRQLQEMAQKRKKRKQAQSNQRHNRLDSLLHQLQSRLKTLTLQKKQCHGSRHRKHRAKISKQMARIQQRIDQLHQARRMRARRLKEERRKQEFDDTDSISELPPLSPTPERRVAPRAQALPEAPARERGEATPPAAASPAKEPERKIPNIDMLLSPSSHERGARRASNVSIASNSSTSEYASGEYWNKRYLSKRKPQEWYESYDQLKSLLDKHLQKTFLILDLGCGDSSMQDSFREEGYQVLGIDISSVILNRMSKQTRELVCADAFNLPFGTGTFDIIIDKATYDSISCDKTRDLRPLLQEIHRILRPTGKYICITPWKPSKRLPQFSHMPWRIEHDMAPMSLQTVAMQRFNRLNAHPHLGRDKDTLMAASYRQAAEQLENLDMDAEKLKPPGQSCVMHVYICMKGRSSMV